MMYNFRFSDAVLSIALTALMSSCIVRATTPEQSNNENVRGIDLQALNIRYRNAIVRIEFTYISNKSMTLLNPTKSENYYGEGGKGAHGSGFFISETEILTNAHVVENARRGSIRITTPSTGNVEFKVEVAGVGGQNTVDLAVLRLPADELMRFKKLSGLAAIPTIKFGDSDKLKHSDPLAIFGYPEESDQLKVIKAEVTGNQYQTSRSQEFEIPYQFIEVGPGGVVQRGNSGGPALDREGTVVGIPTLGDYRGIQGWLIPANIVKRFLPRIRDNQAGKIPLNIPDAGLVLSRNFPGSSVWAGAPEEMTLFELGVRIRDIIPHRLCDDWGLKPGDIIVGFANKQKGISCAIDFEGFQVVTGNLAKWPQDATGISNKDKQKLHLLELFFISEPSDEVTLWYLRPGETAPGSGLCRLRKTTNTIVIKPETVLPHIGVYEKPDYELWGDFVTQDFNEYNTLLFDVPVVEILRGGALITYVEPNSLASRQGLSAGSHQMDFPFSRSISGGDKWYIIETINGSPVKNLAEVKRYLRDAEEMFAARKRTKEYDPARKLFCKERYVQIGTRTQSMQGQIVNFTTAFPIDEALECSSR